MARRLWGFGVIGATSLCLGLNFCIPNAVTAQAPPPQFLRDIAPILDKKGCSVAACHGKFGGRGGFQLSLLTLSPEDDYDPIIRAARGRRVNFLEPEKSLMLQKATNQVGHAGGERFAIGSPEYVKIWDWIAAGAPYDLEHDARLTKLAIVPAEFALPKVGTTQKLHVYARFSDGTTRDVTSYANYESVDTAVATVDANGVVSGKRWGGGSIVVRYLGVVQSSALTLAREDKTPYPKVAGYNLVDEHILSNLKKMNVVPSRLTTDREFIRRVVLDVCGRLPEPAEVDAFVADAALDKRAKLIDKLLDSPEYVDLRTLRLGDLLRISPQHFGNNVGGQRSAALFSEWVHDAVASNMPYDQFVKRLILANGSTYRNGAANFYRVERTAQDRMETIGQAFLGQRMSCARCHKHPFDRWTTDDYWNFAAFMGKVGNRGGDIDGEEEVFYNPGGQVTNQSVTGRRGKQAIPTFLGEKEPISLVADKGTKAEPANLLEKFAGWCVSPENPYFAKATVNRLWYQFLGRGIVHPVDDMRATTPPAIPGLLDAMAADFVGHGYDVKHTMRLILNSRTYQTASDVNATNKLDDKFFSHFYPRPMMGQVLLDTLNQATESTERFGEFPEETKTVQLTLPVGSYFLETFGRSHREFLADLEPKVEPTLVQTLHILNSPYIDRKVKAPNGTVQKLLADKAVTDEKVVTDLYLKTFCRPPSDKEMQAALKVIRTATKRDEAVQDLMWALISAREFYFIS